MPHPPLRDYQEIGVQRICADRQLIVGDDAGLGKTPQALVACDRLGMRRILIVCLKSKKLEWADEIKTWCDGNDTSTTIVGYNPDKPRQTADFDYRENQIKTKTRFCIANFGLLGTITEWTEDAQGKRVKKRDAKGKTIVDDRHLPTFKKQAWDAIIIDECHENRNRQSKVFLGLKAIRREIGKAVKHPLILPMSGTPMFNGPDELWSNLHLCDPVKYSSFWAWAEKECLIVKNYYSGFPEVKGVRNPEELQEKLRSIVMRRMKKDHLTELPDHTIQQVNVELSARQFKHYDELDDKLFTIINGTPVEANGPLALLTRLKQVCVSPDIMVESNGLEGGKIDAIHDILASRGEQQVVIFSQYAKLIRRLHAQLCQKEFVKEYGRSVCFTGEDNINERFEVVKEFGNGRGGPSVLLTTIQAGGTGLNGMQVASIGIMVDKMWAPPRNYQAISRLIRMGQESCVTIYDLIANATVEDEVQKTLGRKEAMFDAVLPIDEISNALQGFFTKHGYTEPTRLDPS